MLLYGAVRCLSRPLEEGRTALRGFLRRACGLFRPELSLVGWRGHSLSCGAECLCVCARCGRRLLLGGVLWVTPVLIAVQDCTTVEAGGAAIWPLLALAMQYGVQVCCTMGMCC